MAHVHLPDGIMPLEWCVLWFLAAGLLVGLAVIFGGRRLELKQRVAAAFLTVIVFVAMLIPVPSPFGGTHMNMTPLAGIVAGPIASALVVLVVSALAALIGHGGVTVLGANMLVLYFECIAAYLVYRALRGRFGVYVSAFAAVLIPLSLSTLLASGILSVSISGSPSYYFSKYAAESILVHCLVPEELAGNLLVHELVHEYVLGNVWLHETVHELSSNPLILWFWFSAAPEFEEFLFLVLRAVELSSPTRFFVVFTAATLPVNLFVAIIEAIVTGVIVQSIVRSRSDIVTAEQRVTEEGGLAAGR
ncbi:MAG: energy-coupling factor ABC transporter permease [Candidatus Jordarchaeales archaeon]